MLWAEPILLKILKLKMIKPLFLLLTLLFLVQGCVAVKEYNKIYINDTDMQLASPGVERFETNFQIYRETAAGANGGKTGGGCGCN